MTAAEATGRNVDPEEISHFSALATDWWDPHGPGRTLHEINPCRLEFITDLAAQCALPDDVAQILLERIRAPPTPPGTDP